MSAISTEVGAIATDKSNFSIFSIEVISTVFSAGSDVSISIVSVSVETIEDVS